MLNNQIFFFFYNFAHHSVFFDKVTIFSADKFPYIVILLAGIFLLVHYDVLPKNPPNRMLLILRARWKEIVFVFSSGIIAWVVADILKLLLKTPRPFIAFQEVHSLISETGYAFPSGHATFFAALAVSIFLIHKKAGYFFIACALVIGLSRIVVGVHFPIDIIGGYVFGTLMALVVYKLANFQKNL